MDPVSLHLSIPLVLMTEKDCDSLVSRVSFLWQNQDHCWSELEKLELRQGLRMYPKKEYFTVLLSGAHIQMKKNSSELSMFELDHFEAAEVTDPHWISVANGKTFTAFFESKLWSSVEDKSKWLQRMILVNCRYHGTLFMPIILNMRIEQSKSSEDDILQAFESIPLINDAKDVKEMIAVKLFLYILTYHPQMLDREKNRLYDALIAIEEKNWLQITILNMLRHVRIDNESSGVVTKVLEALEKLKVIVITKYTEHHELVREIMQHSSKEIKLTNGILDSLKFLSDKKMNLTNFEIERRQLFTSLIPLLSKQAKSVRDMIAERLPFLDRSSEVCEPFLLALMNDLNENSPRKQSWDEIEQTFLSNTLKQLSFYLGVSYINFVKSCIGDTSPITSYSVVHDLCRLTFALLKIETTLGKKFQALLVSSKSQEERKEILMTLYQLAGLKGQKDIPLYTVLTTHMMYGIRIYKHTGLCPWTWKVLKEGVEKVNHLSLPQLCDFAVFLERLQNVEETNRISCLFSYIEKEGDSHPLEFSLALLSVLSDIEKELFWKRIVYKPKLYARFIGSKLEVSKVEYKPNGRTIHNCALLTDACIQNAIHNDWTQTPFYRKIEEARRSFLSESKQLEKPWKLGKFSHMLNRTIVCEGRSDSEYTFVKIRWSEEVVKGFQEECQITEVYSKYSHFQKSHLPTPIGCGKLLEIPDLILESMTTKLRDQFVREGEFDVYVYHAPKSYGEYITEGGAIQGLNNSCYDIGWSISQGIYPEGIFDHNGQGKRRYLPLIDLFRSWGWPHERFDKLSIYNTMGPGRVDQAKAAARKENHRGSGRSDFGDMFLSEELVDDLSILSSDVGGERYVTGLKKDYRRPLLDANALTQVVLEVACILVQRLIHEKKQLWLDKEVCNPSAIKEHVKLLLEAMGELMAGYTVLNEQATTKFLSECGVDWEALSAGIFLAWDPKRHATAIKEGRWPVKGKHFPENAKVIMGQWAENWHPENGYGKMVEGEHSLDIGPFNGPRGLPPVLYLENILASMCLALGRQTVNL